ncbi:MAG: prephenate dehydratase [Promethearchaeota archaeon]
MEEINKLRKEIDNLDKQIAKLIEKRALIAKEIGEIKSKYGIGVVQPIRERQVFNNAKENLKIVRPEAVEAIWREIVSACKLVQGKITRVCFLGPRGTFTQIAAEKYFPKAGTEFIPGDNKIDVFNKVEAGYVDFGIIPIENTIEGSVRESLDLLIEKNLKIYAELEIRIVHCLIARKGTAPSDIKQVISHPQALAQCSRWLNKNLPNAELIEASSTAKAVERVAKANRGDIAAIGTPLAAQIYRLGIIAEGIEDNTQNYTRFLIISKKEHMPTDNDKTSMVFVTRHVPGALFKVLSAFAEAKINLLKIESRPLKGQMWEYAFICDFEGNIHQEHIKKTLERLKEFTVWYKVLGSYPMFQQTNEDN